MNLRRLASRGRCAPSGVRDGVGAGGAALGLPYEPGVGWVGWARLTGIGPDGLLRAGVAGAGLLVVTSYVVGAVPTSFAVSPDMAWLRAGPALDSARIGFYAGIVLLGGAWLGLLRRAVEGSVSARQAVRTAGWWTTPFLVAVPLGSRDAWAYIAQGALVGTHHDPYDVGPGALAGTWTHLSAQVTAVWRSSPSPYGPVWISLSHAAVAAAGGHALLATLLMRLPVVLGQVMIILTAPRLSGHFGGSPALAVCLGAANPVLLVNGIGGAHNDVLMMGLVATAAYVVTSWHSRGALWPRL